VTTLTENRLIDLVIGWVRQNTPKTGINGLEINAETDLIASGLLDSFALVDLIVFIESQSGFSVDFSNADPGEFCIVKGLCRLALSNHQ
jgi:acyl carrier protein